MQNNISALILQQIPEHLRDIAPYFVDFLATYYRYAQQRNKGVGLIQNRHLDFDIDNTLDDYIQEFYDTYSEYIPKSIAYDRRNFIKLLNSIYESKGTEKSLVLLFRTIFNETPIITYPEILRASDGKWIQESFITVNRLFGINPSIGDELITDTNRSVIISNIIEIDSNISRIYFKSLYKIDFSYNQIIKTHYTDGSDKFICELIASPFRLNVLYGGKSWQNGQIITIPGTQKDSLLRVTGVTPYGTITSIEMLEYGYDHIENDISIISPYLIKPVGAYVNTISSSDGLGNYNHLITISDEIEGIGEYLYNSDTNAELYRNSGFKYNSAINLNSNITIEDWFESRAFLEYEYSVFVKTKGYYNNISGQISNNDIRIQDNYFYQVFSYVINSSKDVKNYQQILKITHPAGTKSFSTLSKELTYTLESDVISFILRDIVYFTESCNITEDVVLQIAPHSYVKNLFEETVVTDSFSRVLTNAPIIDSTNVYEILFSCVNVNYNSTLINISDVVNVYELADDHFVAAIETFKYITDTVDATQLETSTITENIITYVDSSYFSQTYVTTEKLLNIGY